MKKTYFALMLWLATGATVCAQVRKQNFDRDWRFLRGSVVNAECVNFDDSRWRLLTVPHDFSMDAVFDTLDYRQGHAGWKAVQVGPFSRQSIGDWDTGQTVGGEGWYRKSYTLPLKPGQKAKDYLDEHEVTLQFDGIYNHSEVWVNGQKVAFNVYGYMPYRIRLNDWIDADGRAVIVVKAVNEGLNSRWYAGSGMMRHVWIETTDKMHLAEWDTFVDASDVDLKKGTASVKVSATIYHVPLPKSAGSLCVDIFGPDGKQVAHGESPFVMDEEPLRVKCEPLVVKNVKLWSVDTPWRYMAHISLRKNGNQECDRLVIPFGARKMEWSAREGFRLNGKPMKLRGGCVHHDNGLLGAAGIDRAEIHKVEQFKQMGYNAVRCSHNLPTEAFLNACDSLGLMVIDEVFDQWEEAKRRHDYSNYFSRPKQTLRNGQLVAVDGLTNAEYDVALMVRRDRNHPSVICWSIGNEIAQRADVPRGQEIAKMLTSTIHQFDTTRPTTIAANDFWDRRQFKWDRDMYRAFEQVDWAGYNYKWDRYEPDHAAYPDRVIYGTESFPNEMAQNWNLIERHPYLIGDFVWTAIDYVGEAGLGHALERRDNRWVQFLSWPWFNAWCGDLDLAGNKKPQSYYRDVLWGLRPIAMAVRPAVPEGEREDVNGWGWTAEECHWNWADGYLPVELRPENYLTTNVEGRVQHAPNAPRGNKMRVNVYSREPRVRLLLNNEVVGTADVNKDTHTATFELPFTPGTLTAQTASSRTAAASVSFTTTDVPCRVVLKADRTRIQASHDDLAYISISIVDKEGRLCPTAEVPLDITLNGKAWLTAGTGHPYDMKSFRTLRPTTFRGHALAILQPQDETGRCTITVEAPGLQSASLDIEMK